MWGDVMWCEEMWRDVMWCDIVRFGVVVSPSFSCLYTVSHSAYMHPMATFRPLFFTSHHITLSLNLLVLYSSFFPFFSLLLWVVCLRITYITCIISHRPGSAIWMRLREQVVRTHVRSRHLRWCCPFSQRNRDRISDRGQWGGTFIFC